MLNLTIPAKDMKLIVVTPPTFFVEEDQIITALFEEGLDILHLRKPETPAMYSERLLTLIPENIIGASSPTSISTCKTNSTCWAST